ncbi:winged helix DNA-binding protein [Hephaestia caeni]|uniref:Winged helix DNA-binding protein n=1 Tax=Hephaestia caeni TaxID=645617 RepID=A0A397NKB1_9SPHN|nr:winged helix DNA-binding protein [Hephaestia caeni]RIA37906.1 winged helix DNA-binding protein [Hephaestia caeni]
MTATFAHEPPVGRVLRALVIGSDAAAVRLAGEAIDAAGARVAGTADPGDAAALDGAVDLVMLEAEALDDATLDELLPRLAQRSRAMRARVIVALGQAQIDPVSRHLLGGEVDLLCAPDVAQRMLAIMLARSSRLAVVGESSREADRLRRMNEEVARIAEALARLAERGPAAPGENVVSDRRPGYRAAEVAPGAIVEARDLRDAIRSRRLRDQYIPGGLFEDPAWDMLLDLFAADLEGGRVSVSSLCIAAAVAPTTALRWIGRMTEAGLLGRAPDPDDRRRAFVMLTPPTRQALLDYCTAAKRQGLPIA